jgi:hypothetical protein
VKRCAWCGGEIASDRRSDSKFCSKRCRQNSHRFHVVPAPAVDPGSPRRFAYADPPYPGKHGLYPEKRPVALDELIWRLESEFPDGWALSTSSAGLLEVFRILEAGPARGQLRFPRYRICAWFKGERPTKSRFALVSWEPVVVAGGRPLPADVVQDLRDGLIAQGRHRAFPGAIIGMKPPAFAEWLFRQLGMLPGDEFCDLFPGSGAMSRAWERYADPSTVVDERRVASASSSPRHLEPSLPPAATRLDVVRDA